MSRHDPSPEIDWPQFAELIGRHQKYLLTTHARADGDALGSELGMASVLEALGKQVNIVNPDGVPSRLTFLDPAGRIQALGEDVAADALPPHDAILVLDTSAWSQLGPMADVLRATSATKIVLDHHVSSDDLGAHVFRAQTAEATGRLVVEAAAQLGVPLSPPAATALFVAQATDTGWYRFNSTTATALDVASRLVEAGAEPAQVYKQLYERDTLARVHLIGRALTRATTELDDRLVFTYLESADFDATGAERDDTEDVVNMIMKVRDTDVALIFVEQSDSIVKVSFRSHGHLDVSETARQFGGGGHKAAAGARVPGPLAGAISRVLDVVRTQMR